MNEKNGILLSLKTNISAAIEKMERGEDLSEAEGYLISEALEKVEKLSKSHKKNNTDIQMPKSVVGQKQETPKRPPNTEEGRHMSINISDLISDFNNYASSSKSLLKEIMSIVSEGKVPQKKHMEDLDISIENLRGKYDSICAAVASQLPAEELPEDGSSIHAYTKALENSESLKYQKAIANARDILQSFIAVKAETENYAMALQTYKQGAIELLRKIDDNSDSNLEKINKDIENPSLFLDAIECNDLAANIDIYSKVMGTFSPTVVLGISTKQYSVDLDKKKELEESSVKRNVTAEIKENVQETVIEEEKSKNQNATTDVSDREIGEISGLAESQDGTDVQATWIPIDEDDDSEEEATWESIGISDPEDVCLDLDKYKMEVRVAHKQKKFNVSSFKNEMSSSYLGAEKLIVLKAIYDMHGVTQDFAMFIADIEEDVFDEVSDRLIRSGYIKEMTVRKRPFEKLEAIYDLTPNGIKAFNTKGSAETLKHKIVKDDNYSVFVPNNIITALSRILFYRTTGLQHKIARSMHLTTVASILSQESFLRAEVDDSTGKKYVLTGIVSNDPDSYQNFLKNLKSNLDNLDKLTVTSIEKNISRNIAQWVSYRVSDKCSKEKIYYHDADQQILYSLLDDSEIKLPLITELRDDESDSMSNDEAIVEAQDNDEELDAASSVNGPSDEEHSEEKVTNKEDKTISASTVDDVSAETMDLETFANHYLKSDDADGSSDSLKDVGSEKDKAENETYKSAPISDSTDIPETEEPVPDKADHVITSGNGQNEYALNLTGNFAKKYRENYQQMLISGAFYCATAYLRALADRYDDFKPEYEQVAYALNDPMAMCSYSSDKVFSVYFSEQAAVSEYLTLAAVIRNYFLDQCRYDYSLQSLQDSVTGFDILQNNHALSQVVYILQKFKSSNNRGVDFYADYRQKGQKENEELIKHIRTDARDYYDKICIGYVRDPVFHLRLRETKRLLLSEETDLAYCVEIARDDKRSELELVKDFIRPYIKENEDIHEDNIDQIKIEAIVTEKWNEAGKIGPGTKKKMSDLTGSYRSTTCYQVRKLLSIVCRYYVAVSSESFDTDDSGMIDYKRIRKDLIENIHKASNSLTLNPSNDLVEESGKSVLIQTLKEMLSRIEGDYIEQSKRYYYIDFLKGDKVTLDEDYFPMLDDVAEVDELSALSRIEDHYREAHESLEVNLKTILKGEDDYGTAKLILSYLELNPGLVEDKDLLTLDIQKAAYYPRKDLETKRKAFIEDLELAQSYGQIDNTVEDRKESFIQIMDSWYSWAIETSNYGFFYKILEAIRKKIREDAQVRALELENNLKVYMDDHKNWSEDELTETTIHQIKARISDQNYAAAEDLLNRLISGDLNTDTIYDLNQDLEDFIKEYTLNANKVSKAGATVQALHTRIYNKDSKGANRLIEYWPNHKGTPANKIASLLTVLGFSIDKVEQQPDIQGKNHYLVSLKKPVNGRKSNYKHPIAVFGSEAEEKGFRVVTIYGKMDAGRLIDTFKEIGTARTTMVILDYSLTLHDRRELARRTKTEYNGRTFIVIDRVVLAYLANHYSETAINRRLMAVTMPYAAYQPYIAESSMIMPQEIFMGRRKELDKIESATGVNIVYGGRQLGKSALLRMARKDIDKDENGDRAVLVDIKGLDYKAAAKKISGALYDEGVLLTEHITEDWDELSRDISNRLRDDTEGRKIPYFLLLLDEADVFIESCESVGYRPFDALKDIQGVGSGRFKFVVAGLRNIVRFKKNAALSNNSVITHLGSLTVTPFKSVEARELLEVPLSYLGFRFPNDNKTEMLISTIFGTTNYFPGLIQLYCSKLIEAMQRDYAGYNQEETPPYYVREEHIKKALADKTLEQQIKEKFFITLKVDEDDYYYLIALLAAYNYHNNKGQNGCGADDIVHIAEDFGIEKISSLSIDKVLALMEEMRELNILQKVRDGRYRFARHSFCQMMGSITKIDDDIMKYAVDEEM